jgi:hypothetical protein
MDKYLVTYIDSINNKCKSIVVKSDSASSAKKKVKKKSRYNLKAQKVGKNFT